MNQEKIGAEYFYDTYALVEIVKRNENYKPYLYSKMHILNYNLIELYYNLLRDHGEEIAKKYYLLLKNNVFEISDEVLFDAMKFKKENSKKSFSYVDCLGYSYALHKKIKFLTGDREFRGMKNVEFVK
ncbi:MAG: PIN domain-containing protein [Candidatus Woesearchaeota archaeon]|jgi:hypothetical protein